MTHYKTKLEAYEAGRQFERDLLTNWAAGQREEGIKLGIAQERARAKKKVNPLYNRRLSLKERVDREAEVDKQMELLTNIMGMSTDWQGLGKTKQPNLWERFKKIASLGQYKP